MASTKDEVTQRKVAEDFDRSAQTYVQQVEDAVAFSGMDSQFLLKAKRDRLMRLVQESLGDPARVRALDLGCGVGAFHPMLEGAFASLTGIDVSQASIDHARAVNPDVSYDCYPGGTLPYESGSFDLVFAVCVMHHVPTDQWPSFVAEMRRVLRPGGLAVVFEHNPLNPLTQYIVRTCPIDRDAVLLWPAKIRALFEDAAFSKVDTKTLLSVPPQGGALTAIDGWLGYLPFGAQYHLRATA